MKKLEKCFRIIPYVFEFKTNLVCGLLFWVLGIFYTISSITSADNDFNSMIGPVYIVLGPMMVVQLAYSILVSKMISASPKRKWLELVLSNVLTGLNTLISYVLIVILVTVQVVKQPGNIDTYIKFLFYTVVLTVILNIHFAACYKQMLLSSCLFFGCYVGTLVMLNTESVTTFIRDHFAGDWTRMVIEGAVLSAVGFLLSCLLRKALYKLEMSSCVGGLKLRKMMQ